MEEETGGQKMPKGCCDDLFEQVSEMCLLYGRSLFLEKTKLLVVGLLSSVPDYQNFLIIRQWIKGILLYIFIQRTVLLVH
jgi:hypothetical protein